jgi:hypothetical protein
VRERTRHKGDKRGGERQDEAKRGQGARETRGEGRRDEMRDDVRGREERGEER